MYIISPPLVRMFIQYLYFFALLLLHPRTTRTVNNIAEQLTCIQTFMVYTFWGFGDYYYFLFTCYCKVQSWSFTILHSYLTHVLFLLSMSLFVCRNTDSNEKRKKKTQSNSLCTYLAGKADSDSKCGCTSGCGHWWHKDVCIFVASNTYQSFFCKVAMGLRGSSHWCNRNNKPFCDSGMYLF